MKKIYALLLLFFAFGNSFSQSLSVLQAKEAIENGKYKKAIKKAEKGLEKDKMLYELYFLKAWAQLEGAMQIEEERARLREMKQSVRTISRVMNKQPDTFISNKYTFILKRIANEYAGIGYRYYYRKQYRKALPFLEDAWKLSNDTLAYAALGLSKYEEGDTSNGVKMLDTAILWSYQNWQDSSKPIVYDSKNKSFEEFEKTYTLLSCQYLAEHFANRNEEDLSLGYIEIGLEMFPEDYKLTRTVVDVIERKIKKQTALYGLNSTTKRWIDQGLKYENNRTYFLNMQNQYFLHRLNYVFNRNDSSVFLATDADFYREKKALAKAGSVNEKDPFLTEDSFLFVTECLKHFMSRDNPVGILHYFYKWYPLSYKTPQLNEEGLQSILSNPPTFVSQRLLYVLSNHAVNIYDKNETIKKARYDLYKKWLDGTIQGVTWNYLFNWNVMLAEDFPKKKFEFRLNKEKILTRGIDSFLVYDDLASVWGFYRLLTEEFPENADLDSLNKKIALADFHSRYKGSRIFSETNGSETKVFTGWNGYSKRCTAGKMPDSTIAKIGDRINYFRQNAGYKRILPYNPRRSKKCQEASVMYAPIGVFTREPTPETHICYTKDAAEAAAFSQMVKDPNPAIAATVLMADNKSDELYNRQYVLAPNARSFAFGASENNSVYWMVQPSEKLNKKDSAWFKKNFISWPPAGYCPRMFLFSKWSFMMDQNLEGATVTLKSLSLSTVKAESKVEKSPFLPYSTLVINPKITAAEARGFAKDEIIDVQIKLKNRKTIGYQVKVLDIE